MIHLSTRMASLVLAFGIFFAISCTSTKNVVQIPNENSSEETFDEQLRSLNERITESPDDQQLYVEKARLLADYATTFSMPDQRLKLYKNLRNLSSENHGKQADIVSIKKDAWNKEHNSGLQLLQEDSDISYQQAQIIIAHFDNAITLIPDSLQTYNLKATTLYRIGNLHAAIETLETAKTFKSTNTSTLDEKIAYLHLESGNIQEALYLYNKLSEVYPDDENYRNGFINTLILNEQHEEAISILKELSEQYPARFFYQEALATETFFLVRKKSEELLQSNPDELNVEEKLNMITTYLSDSHSIFDALSSDAPIHEESTLRIAAFYKNSASLLSSLADELEIEAEIKEELEEMYLTFTEKSLPSWERLAEINPNNLDYLVNLKEVYQALGMNEEADAIERSINF